MVLVKNSVSGACACGKGQFRYKGKIHMAVKHHHFIQQQAGNHHIMTVKQNLMASGFGCNENFFNRFKVPAGRTFFVSVEIGLMFYLIYQYGAFVVVGRVYISFILGNVSCR